MAVLPGAHQVGIGCMRLSTAADRDEARAVAVLHAAFDAGVTFFDTADAYCRDDGETGHNERLIARALAAWPGDRTRIVVATKGGLRRPQGRWVPDGRARHLAAACEASLRALGVERLPLYQLHAVDPRTPLATSVRALDGLRRRGLVEAIGLCNVTVGQIDEARRITAIDAVQVEVSAWRDTNLLNGVVAHCLALDIPIIAYRPLGGTARTRRLESDPVLAAVAGRRGATPAEIALAWLGDLSPRLLPIPGPTTVAHARSAARARTIVLTEEDRGQLDGRSPAARALRDGPPPVPRPPPRTDREVVLIMGLPGAGKSTLAATFVARGHTRLNRDLSGGTLADLLPALDEALSSGAAGVVLDNTYLSRQSRAPVIQAARRHDVAVRCVFLATSLEDAQVNAVFRMVSRHGRLLAPDEIRRLARHDPAVFGPTVQSRCGRELEPPDLAEGFSQVEVVPFERRADPSHVNRALIVWCDGILWHSRSGQRAPSVPDDVEVKTEHGALLRRYQSEGWRVLGLSWQPGIEDGTATHAGVDAALVELRAGLGMEIEVGYCPHAAGPPRCWCRKPLPGLGVAFVQRHALDAASSLYLGRSAQDAVFARRMGFNYRVADEIFTPAP